MAHHEGKQNTLSTIPLSLLILEQSAHCDWDWVEQFPQYYSSNGVGVEEILTAAIQDLKGPDNPPYPPYIYSFCEMAYLQRFLQQYPQTLPSNFNISSGGITSADNLLTHGEAFIRNYLIGRQWITQANPNIALSDYLWIPDDFGHDAQLPIVLQAMGFRGVGFWRIPVNAPKAPNATKDAPSSRLMKTGVDFIWRAADNSTTQAHWLRYSYCQGNNPNGNPNISGLISQSSDPPYPTPYLFVPVDCDFCMPYANLPAIVSQWNQGPPTPSVTAEMSTFADFMDRVYAYNQEHASLHVYKADQSDKAWVPNPFYSGTYGSQPELKRLHYLTTRTLLFAETMEVLLEYLARTYGGNWDQVASSARDNIASAWNDLMPSTHHDYITGTAGNTSREAGNPVYTCEQLPLLKTAQGEAQTFLDDVLSALAGTIRPTSTEAAVAVFNPLAFARTDIAAMTAPANAPIYQSSTLDGTTYTPVQYTPDGSQMLFLAEAPSMGYACVNLSTDPPNTFSLPTLQPVNGNYVLSNQFLQATVSLGSPTGITSLIDLESGTNMVKGNGTANQVVFYLDQGNIYRFGNELSSEYQNEFYADSTQQLQIVQETTESGPLYVSITLQAQLGVHPATAIPYEICYSLYGNEPFLRMEVTGAAPSGYSVMLGFPLASASQPDGAAIQSLTYGTPYHWDTRQPRNYFLSDSQPTVEQICFEPTHDFVMPLDTSNNILGAVYHASTPGWAIDPQRALLGCILRNVPGTQNAASASDPDPHAAAYALRVPSGLDLPQAGCGPSSPLGEALRFNNPLYGILLPANNQDGVLPETISIAGTSDTRALITTAKTGTMTPGDLILRVYQPTNEALPALSITLDADIASSYQSNGSLNVAQQTALETSIAPAPDLGLVAGSNTFSFDQPFALITFALQPTAQTRDGV